MMTTVFIIAFLGYLLVVFEGVIKINKTITALLTGTLTWFAIAFYSSDKEQVTESLMHNFSEISSLLIFLLIAMTIVEFIDIHKGFSVITHRIRTKSIVKLFWIISFITFFLSSILDNLATTIIMLALLKKILPKSEIRMVIAGFVVIAANAGGAFSPVGDITTTLLWIGGQLSTMHIFTTLFLPAFAAMLVPLLLITYRMKGFAVLRAQVSMKDAIQEEKIKGSMSVFIAGAIGLFLVPFIKTITGLPPFIAILFSLCLVAFVSYFYHYHKTEEEKHKYSITYALTKVDVNSILYFLGILLMVFALQEATLLSQLAAFLVSTFPDVNFIAISLGILSSLVDNGSLVAASQGMFSLEQFPMDDNFWSMIAFCTGTGGSIFIIGSAAGIAVMEKEKLTFLWYFKKIGIYALIGFASGIAVLLLQMKIFNS
jgi:Na+/H+ antiporter NhaD/arsenite permease-like protein